MSPPTGTACVLQRFKSLSVTQQIFCQCVFAFYGLWIWTLNIFFYPSVFSGIRHRTAASHQTPPRVPHGGSGTKQRTLFGFILSQVKTSESIFFFLTDLFDVEQTSGQQCDCAVARVNSPQKKR